MFDVSDPGGCSAVKLEFIMSFHGYGSEMSELVSQFMGSGLNPIYHGGSHDDIRDD